MPKTTTKKAAAPKTTRSAKIPTTVPEEKAAEKAPAANAKPKKPATKKTGGEASPKRLSAIDAAAQVLAASKEPMNCKALIEAMATKNLWTSPGGKTPAATLYAAILREITVKGAESRFVKADRGQFTAKG